VSTSTVPLTTARFCRINGALPIQTCRIEAALGARQAGWGERPGRHACGIMSPPRRNVQSNGAVCRCGAARCAVEPCASVLPRQAGVVTERRKMRQLMRRGGRREAAPRSAGILSERTCRGNASRPAHGCAQRRFRQFSKVLFPPRPASSTF